MRVLLPVLCAILLPWLSLQAEDTLRVTLRQADSLLAARSLALVAQQAEIDKAEAERIQARLFHNPQFSSEWVVGRTGEPFIHAGAGGQKILAVEQLFRIAGQRSLAVRAAENGKRITEAQYAELAAALRLKLHSTLYRQYYTQRSVDAIASQLQLLKQLQEAYGGQYDKGNVSLKQVTRLRTAFFALNAQRIQLLRQLNRDQQDLRAMLAETGTVIASPTAAELQLPTAIPLPPDTLVSMAVQQRHAAVAAQAAQEAAALDLKLQRRMAVPDLALGAQYNQVGDLHPRQTAVTIGFSVPLFDRNQGRIRWAEAAGKHAEATLRQTQLDVRNEVLYALEHIRVLQEQLDATNPGLDAQLDQLSESLVDNYVRNNIKLIEFTDLFESYNSTIIDLNQLMADLQNAYEELEYATGRNLFGR
ncbi:MAG: TolC family protein [Flavobacteriales bacterium]|nr:TolC family protein [Flavobacteriales bacterium]